MQKSAVKLIMGDKNKSYEESLQILNLQRLSQRREVLCLNFALKTTKSVKMKHMFHKKRGVRLKMTRHYWLLLDLLLFLRI